MVCHARESSSSSDSRSAKARQALTELSGDCTSHVHMPLSLSRSVPPPSTSGRKKNAVADFGLTPGCGPQPAWQPSAPTAQDSQRRPSISRPRTECENSAPFRNTLSELFADLLLSCQLLVPIRLSFEPRCSSLRLPILPEYLAYLCRESRDSLMRASLLPFA